MDRVVANDYSPLHHSNVPYVIPRLDRGIQGRELTKPLDSRHRLHEYCRGVLQYAPMPGMTIIERSKTIGHYITCINKISHACYLIITLRMTSD